MIDHLMIAADQDTLVAAIGSHNPDGRGALWSADNGWRSDIAFVVTITDAATMVSQQSTDANGNPITIQVPSTLTDYHLWVALPTQDATLSALSNCALVADRDAANAGNPNFILQTAMTPTQLNSYAISPVFAGSNYPFGNLQ